MAAYDVTQMDRELYRDPNFEMFFEALFPPNAGPVVLTSPQAGLDNGYLQPLRLAARTEFASGLPIDPFENLRLDSGQPTLGTSTLMADIASQDGMGSEDSFLEGFAREEPARSSNTPEYNNAIPGPSRPVQTSPGPPVASSPRADTMYAPCFPLPGLMTQIEGPRMDLTAGMPCTSNLMCAAEGDIDAERCVDSGDNASRGAINAKRRASMDLDIERIEKQARIERSRDMIVREVLLQVAKKVTAMADKVVSPVPDGTETILKTVRELLEDLLDDVSLALVHTICPLLNIRTKSLPVYNYPWTSSRRWKIPKGGTRQYGSISWHLSAIIERYVMIKHPKHASPQSKTPLIPSPEIRTGHHSQA
jgi:hypothetical protein